MSEPIRRRVGGVSCLHRSGPGPTVVMLHGVGSNAGSFETLFNVLPPDMNLLAWDAPGYMESEPLDEPWPRAEDYARALAGFLDEIGVGSAYLLGHSLGSLMAAAFARLYPDRVGRLALAAAANGYGAPRGATPPPRAADRIADLERLGTADFARARAPNLVHDPARHPELVRRVEAAMAQVNPAGYAQAVRMLASADLAGMIGDVGIEPGFIIGAEDRVTPIDQTRRAAAAWEGAHGRKPRVIVIEGAGHAVYAQKPEAFAAALLDLIGEPQDARGPITAEMHGGD